MRVIAVIALACIAAVPARAQFIGLSGSPGVDTECVMAGMEKAKDQLQ